MKTDYNLFRMIFIYSKDLSLSKQCSSNPNVPTQQVLSENSNSGHNSTVADLNQITLINTGDEETYTYDTLDTLPHSDHYRNLFSFTLSEPKSRPTLEVLHGTANPPSKYKLESVIDLNSEIDSTMMIPNEQALPIETKPKVAVVKLGWIVGVLVCFFIQSIFSIEVLPRLGSMYIEYIWCYVISSSIMGYGSGWNRFRMCNYSHVGGRDCFNNIINERYLYEW